MEIIEMSITRPNTFIPYFTAYLIHYIFFYWIATCDRQKLIVESQSTLKNTPIKK